MKSFARIVIFVLLTSLLLLTACGARTKEFSTHSSNDGNTPEHFMPADLGLMFSYSLREEIQFENLQAMEAVLKDEGRLSETVSEDLNNPFENLGLDYEKDLKPAFGEQFRMLYGLKPSIEEASAYSIVILEKPDLMQMVLEKLVESGDLEEKNLSKVDAYVSEESTFYASMYEDLLLVSNEPEGLVEMNEMNEDESLWASDLYQDGLLNVGADHLLYGMIFPEFYSEDLALAGSFSVGDIPAVIDRQTFVLRAEEDGLGFDVIVEAKEEEAKASGVSFDAVPKSKPYLFDEVPAENLMAYLESFGLKQTFEQAQVLGDQTATLEGLETTFRNYFAMDFMDDFLVFLDKGYSLSLHKNSGGVLPGISILIDASSDTDAAQTFADKFDGQLSTLIVLFEGFLPRAVSKGEMNVGDTKLDALVIDLTALGDTSYLPLPEALTSSVVKIAYGLVDDKLLITTADVWGSDADMIADSELYKSLQGKLDGANEGLILMDASGLADFVASLRALREDLALGVSENSVDLEEFLEGFSGAIAESKTSAYEIRYNGFLMLSE